MSMNAIPLSQLANQVKAALSASFTEPIWIVAEIQEFNVNRTGHCYMELVEKDTDSDKLLAKIKATIWAYTFRMLRPYFESTTGYSFGAGLKLMFKANVVFHELYGFSLNITDVDPNYTLGDISRRRQEVISQLQADGVMELNKEFELSEVPQRIAIISSPTAAGYGDFYDQLHNNDHGFVFYTALFSATMQGDSTETSIIQALEKIYEYEEYFDVVVIIRGGGSKSDLAAFDTYDLAFNIAQFPLPVLAGIGHERDQSVVDLVAFQSLKTPTAVAEFLIDKIHQIASEINTLHNDLHNSASEYVGTQKSIVERLSSKLAPLVQVRLSEEKVRVGHLEQNLRHATERFLSLKKNIILQSSKELQHNVYKALHKELEHIRQLEYRIKSSSLACVRNNKNRVELLSNSLRHLDPHSLLDRGFSVTYLDGKPLSSTENLKKGRIIVTHLSDGEIRSEVL